MKYKIIGDSCTDITPDDYKKGFYFSVPLTITIDDYTIIDDDTFDQKDFLRREAASPNCPKSACPSPGDYIDRFKDAEEIYIVTLTSKLSGSYNSALVASQMYTAKHPEVKIHVFDSRSASSGQLLIAYRVEKCKKKGMSFEETVADVEKFSSAMVTTFVLESLEALRKNGRLTRMKAFIAGALNIKPCLHAVDGEIEVAYKCRGINKALSKMVDYIGESGKISEGLDLILSHCNCAERAAGVAAKIREKYPVINVKVIDMHGISSLYASDGGIIVAF